MADAPKGRGRARGRARQAPAPAQPPAAAPQPRPAPPPAAAAASGPPSSGSSSTSSRPPVGRSARAPNLSAGDVTARMSSLSVGGNGNGNGSNGNGNGGNGSRSAGRGAVRPSRESTEVLRTRPEHATNKMGTTGTHVKLMSNFFELRKKQNATLCKHHIDILPQEDRTFMKKILVGQHREKLGGYLFDGSTLFTLRNLCQNGKPMELVSQNREGTNYTITIRFVGTVEPSDYQYLQVFNIIMRDCLSKLKLQLIRRNYYDPAAKIMIPEHKLELWPGYITSVIQCEDTIMLQSEISYKVLRKDTAYDLLQKCLADTRTDIQTSYSTAMIGTVIITLYNNKTYRIDEVDFEATPRSTFEQERKGVKTNIRYMDYFKDRYSLRCHDENQPMLISKNNARSRRAGLGDLVYLIPEFCVMTGLTDDMRSNFQLMKAVSAHTCVAPGNRVTRLKNFNQRLTNIPEVRQKLDLWGLDLRPNLVDINGRVLPNETIYVANGKQYDAGREANWDRNLRSNKMLHSVDITNWVILFLGRSSRDAREFCSKLTQAARGMQYTIANPSPYELNSDRASDYVNTLERAINEKNPQLVMCIMPNNNAARYSAIKKKCIIDKPVPSQVVLYKTMTNKNVMSIATKVAIQMNCKVGGAPWGVEIPLKGLMTIGYDVCHDPKDKRFSYGAMVATLDQNNVRWYSNITRHSSGEELSISFAFNVEKCVQKYMEANNGALPNYIIIYRDGVGEGQVQYVRDLEVAKIKESLEPLYQKAGKPLRMAFIVVTKRINTRIFMGDQNPSPGTIVDSVVTSPFRYDFFLVSQSVRQGTVSPTHFNIIEDTSGLKIDHIQRLTFKMCHLYFNWSGTVRVPAPCQYAHKLAFLTAQSIGMVHSNLDRLLYYL